MEPWHSKCFDAIKSLQFGTQKDKQTGLTVPSTDILAMVSPEKESVSLGKGLKARGNVEEWLGKVEEAMRTSLKKCMKIAVQDYFNKTRPEWTIAGKRNI